MKSRGLFRKLITPIGLRRSKFLPRGIWGVGLVKLPIYQFLKGWPEDATTIWLDDPDAGFHADPFALRVDGRTLVLTEHVPGPGMRGEIVARELGEDDRLIKTKRALRLPIHMSYPFVFEQDGTQYCIPETIQADGVLLFRAIGPEPKWVFEGRLIDGFPAADSTVVHYEGRFWLFCTRYALEPGDPVNSELHIFHASAMRGPWLPHARNPVKVDRSNARPAGTPFVHDGDLFRPAQDCSQVYGGAVNVNRVAVLTEAEFIEEAVGVIPPRTDGPFPDGLHHLCAFGSYTFIDGKRMVRDQLPEHQGLPVPGDAAALAAALAELTR